MSVVVPLGLVVGAFGFVAGQWYADWTAAGCLVVHADLAPSLAAANTAVGVVLALTGSSHQLPDGWLKCDGRQIPQADYPELAKVLGQSGQMVGLPDYRGMSLVMVGKVHNNCVLDGALRVVAAEGESVSWFVKSR